MTYKSHGVQEDGEAMPMPRQRRRKAAPEKAPPMMSPIKSLFGRRVGSNSFGSATSIFQSIHQANAGELQLACPIQEGDPAAEGSIHRSAHEAACVEWAWACIANHSQLASSRNESLLLKDSSTCVLVRLHV